MKETTSLKQHNEEFKKLGSIRAEYLKHDDKKACFECGDVKELTEFEPTKKKLLKTDKGHVRVCNECIDKRIIMKFALNDKVTKVKGYGFTGEIVAMFTNSQAQVRVVVEHFNSRTETAAGILHIYNEGQLELTK